MKILCPHCKQTLDVNDEMEGQYVSCPTCNKPFTIELPHEKTCPFCSETIKSAAIRCRYCQSNLTEQNNNINSIKNNESKIDSNQNIPITQKEFKDYPLVNRIIAYIFIIFFTLFIIFMMAMCVTSGYREKKAYCEGDIDNIKAEAYDIFGLLAFVHFTAKGDKIEIGLSSTLSDEYPETISTREWLTLCIEFIKKTRHKNISGYWFRAYKRKKHSKKDNISVDVKVPIQDAIEFDYFKFDDFVRYLNKKSIENSRY